MERRTLRVGPDQAGKTVARILHDDGGFSHAGARGLVQAGLVRRNGRTVSRGDERVGANDRIELVYDPARRYRGPRSPKRAEGYRVLYEDRDLVVVDKEPGLLTVPTPTLRGASLLEILDEQYRNRGHRRARVWPVHRIDRFTSGLVAFARTAAAHAALRAQFASGKPERVYLAVAEGRVGPDHGRLVHDLAQNPRSLKVHLADAASAGRRAASSYRVIERFAHATLLEVRLETGRRNQIRVQLAAEGHPLVGDRAYGRPSPLLPRTALHAARLAFDHPADGRRVEFESDPPADFKRLLALLRGGQSPTSTSTPV